MVDTKFSVLCRPCTSENLKTMGSLGSPFDAPLPRFQQAAAHLSNSLGQSSSKKPPLSEPQSLLLSMVSCNRQLLELTLMCNVCSQGLHGCLEVHSGCYHPLLRSDIAQVPAMYRNIVPQLIGEVESTS